METSPVWRPRSIPAIALIVPTPPLFTPLARRLEAAVAGTDPWLNKQLETDEEMVKEVTNKEIIKEVFATTPRTARGYTPLLHCRAVVSVSASLLRDSPSLF